jgi:hypothetical protein
MTKLYRVFLERTITQTAEVVVEADGAFSENEITNEVYAEYEGEWKSQPPTEGTHVVREVRPDLVLKPVLEDGTRVGIRATKGVVRR